MENKLDWIIIIIIIPAYAADTWHFSNNNEQ